MIFVISKNCSQLASRELSKILSQKYHLHELIAILLITKKIIIILIIITENKNKKKIK